MLLFWGGGVLFLLLFWSDCYLWRLGMCDMVMEGGKAFVLIDGGSPTGYTDSLDEWTCVRPHVADTCVSLSANTRLCLTFCNTRKPLHA